MPVALETQRIILSCLLDISEYSVIVRGDICKHNYEALAAFLFAFPGLIPEADSFSNGLSDDFRKQIIENAAAYAMNRLERER